MVKLQPCSRQRKGRKSNPVKGVDRHGPRATWVRLCWACPRQALLPNLACGPESAQGRSLLPAAMQLGPRMGFEAACTLHKAHVAGSVGATSTPCAWRGSGAHSLAARTCLLRDNDLSAACHCRCDSTNVEFCGTNPNEWAPNRSQGLRSLPTPFLTVFGVLRCNVCSIYQDLMCG